MLKVCGKTEGKGAGSVRVHNESTNHSVRAQIKKLFKKKQALPAEKFVAEERQTTATELLDASKAGAAAASGMAGSLEPSSPLYNWDSSTKDGMVSSQSERSGQSALNDRSDTRVPDVVSEVAATGVQLGQAKIPIDPSVHGDADVVDLVSVDAESSDGSAYDEEPEEEFDEQLELEDFKLISRIGEGAFSRVYRAIPQPNSSKSYLYRTFQQVAVKVINKQQLDSSHKDSKSKATSKEQVLKEVAIHRTVSASENVVSFVDFHESPNYYFIVQELLAGGEIFGEIVRLTYFSEDLSRHVIRQLALAVKHMHALGIVHRDIKPENLLFEPVDFIPSTTPVLRKSDDPRSKQDEGVFRPGVGGGGIGVVKLADFGLSKQIYSTNTKTPCGTVGYTAPEVVKDERYSMKVDMWGIGCVLYTVLCGFPPFYDEKIDVLTEKISKGEFTFLRPWWDEISEGARNAVRNLLEVDPAKRYDIDQFLADPWLNQYDCLRSQGLKHRNESSENVHTRAPKKKRKHNHLAFKRDSSLLYSPAAVAMRDAFEVNNALKREEESKRRTAPAGVNLGLLPEDEEMGLENDMFQLRLNSSTIIKRRKNKDDPIEVPPTLVE
ncbi:LANO_0G14004g1_1 [Lachancea nothofagi CBS 11611]|uniref:non-specific serine/threonine protein kinase n=1 Tax=Lachancea nothofagi CBS 11611 TaxID=1266666 RepID=A0A1G4KKA4_9SACH|nr:LANO_0G14004g1_1 [Lachancea nothofagi CBS 11611]